MEQTPTGAQRPAAVVAYGVGVAGPEAEPEPSGSEGPDRLWGAYLILDARYEKVREHGVTRSQAVLIAIGIGWDGHRHILGVELANRESRGGWKDFLVQLRERGRHGVVRVQ